MKKNKDLEAGSVQRLDGMSRNWTKWATKSTQENFVSYVPFVV